MKVYLSDPAKQGLREVLYRYGFDGQRRMLGTWLRACDDWDVHWIDARPIHTVLASRVALRWDAAPIWNQGDARALTEVGGVPRAYLESVARQHAIRPFREQLRTLAGVDLSRPAATRLASTCGPVMEAIGLGWLVPAEPALVPKRHANKVTRKVSIYVGSVPPS